MSSCVEKTASYGASDAANPYETLNSISFVGPAAEKGPMDW